MQGALGPLELQSSRIDDSLNRNLHEKDLLGLRGSTACCYQDFNWEKHRFRISRAVEARQLHRGPKSMLFAIELLIEMGCWVARALEVRNRCFFNRNLNGDELSSLQSSGGPKSMFFNRNLDGDELSSHDHLGRRREECNHVLNGKMMALESIICLMDFSKKRNPGTSRAPEQQNQWFSHRNVMEDGLRPWELQSSRINGFL